jgi:hypothetical protein
LGQAYAFRESSFCVVSARLVAFAADNVQTVLVFRVALLPLIAPRLQGLQIAFGLQPACVQLALRVVLRHIFSTAIARRISTTSGRRVHDW